MSYAGKDVRVTTPFNRKSQSDPLCSFEGLVCDLIPGMTARANRILHSPDDAQDAVQEALVIAFTKIDQLREVERFPGWFKAIVDSTCYRLLAKRIKEVSLADISQLEPIAPASFDPATRYEKVCFRSAAVQAIAQLSPKLREVAGLYYESGYSVGEIADILSLKKGTVRKRIHGARPFLADALAPQFGNDVIRVGYLPISDHLLGMVAHKLCRGRSSRIQMQRFLSWEKLSSALQKQQIDAAFMMAPLAMQLCNSGIGLRYILDGHHDGSALTATSSELRGKLVGVPGRFSTHRVLLRKMAIESPDQWGSVTTADTNPSYAIGSLKKNIIDAFFCAEPWNTKCVSEGGADIVVRSKDVAPGHPCCVVVVHSGFFQARTELVADYVSLLLQARDKLFSDVSYCADIQARYTGVRSDMAARVLESGVITFADLRPDKGRMADFMRLSMESGVLSEACDLDKFVCTDFK